MIPLCSPPALLPLKPPLQPGRRSLLSSWGPFRWTEYSTHVCKGGRRKAGRCRAELAQDAPFAAAIGACVLTSLVLPAPLSPDEDSGGAGGSAIDSTDARFAVMSVISCIPYFNWLSWVFAWLDTGSRRYLVYSIVYLVPYLRTNLSLSPDESWLPIASIVFCIVHVQLEASIKNGDIKSVDLFGNALNLLPPVIRKKDSGDDTHQEKSKGSSKQRDLPSAEDSENQIREWMIPEKPSDDPPHANDDEGKNERSK